MSNDLGCSIFSTSSADATNVFTTYALGSDDIWAGGTCIATTVLDEPITLAAGNTISYTYTFHYAATDGKGNIEVVPFKKKKWNHEEQMEEYD